MTELFIFKINRKITGSKFSNKMSDKYTDDQIKKSSNFMWFQLEEIIKQKFNILLKNEDISFNKCGKPIFKNYDIFFNISHCNELGIIGVSDKEIGVDIEKLISKTKSNYIIEYFNCDKNISRKDLTKRWVLYESKCKFLGSGIPIKFNECEIEGQIYEDCIRLNKHLFYIAVTYKDKTKLGGVIYDL